MNDELKVLATEALAYPFHHVEYFASDFYDCSSQNGANYLAVAANAAPKLARAWQEQQAENARLREQNAALLEALERALWEITLPHFPTLEEHHETQRIIRDAIEQASKAVHPPLKEDK